MLQKLTDIGSGAPVPKNAVLEGWFKRLQKLNPGADRDNYFSLSDKKQALEMLKQDIEIWQHLHSRAYSVTDIGTGQTPSEDTMEFWFRRLQKVYPRAHRDDYFLHDKKQACELLKLDMEIMQHYRRVCEACTGIFTDKP